MAAAAQNSHAHAIVGSRGVSMAAAAQNSLPKKGECEETPLDVVSSSTSPGFPEKKIIPPTINPEPEVHPGIPEPDPLSTLQEDPPMANPDPVLKNLMTYINQHDFIPDTTVDKIVAAVSKYKDNPLATSIKDTILSNQVMAKAAGYDGR